MDLQSAVIAQQAAARQSISMEVVKQAASVQQQVANIISQSAHVPVSGSLGGNVSLSA